MDKMIHPNVSVTQRFHCTCIWNEVSFNPLLRNLCCFAMCPFSQTLDLTNPATFRDFSLPMGAQSKERLQRFIDRYNLTKEDPTGTANPQI